MKSFFTQVDSTLSATIVFKRGAIQPKVHFLILSPPGLTNWKPAHWPDNFRVGHAIKIKSGLNCLLPDPRKIIILKFPHLITTWTYLHTGQNQYLTPFTILYFMKWNEIYFHVGHAIFIKSFLNLGGSH